jgi:hypothetical protein
MISHAGRVRLPPKEWPDSVVLWHRLREGSTALNSQLLFLKPSLGN